MVPHSIPDPEDVRAMADHDRKAAKEQHAASQAVYLDARRAVYIDELAECLYQTAVLCGHDDAVDDWRRLPISVKAKYRFEATAALNRLLPAKRIEAELRAREQVADAHYGKAYHLLGGPAQRAIAFQVRTALHMADRVLEGIFQPLPATIALTLEPGTDEVAS